MKCPFCNSTETSVLESRVGIDGECLRRRRECDKCHRRFTTYERAEGLTLMVVKKDKKRELFDREKLAKGIRKAFHKRPVPVEAIEKLVDDVERELLRRGVQEIESNKIGQVVLRKIKKLDKVAWLRFASVYLAFEDLTDFERLISQQMKQENKD